MGLAAAAPVPLLRLVERRLAIERPTLVVVGAADGKFVLPAARCGWQVVAVEIDRAMVDGCPACPRMGIVEAVPGLRARLQTERLSAHVDIHIADYMTDYSIPAGHALYVSGALQYSFNSHYGIQDMVRRLRSLVLKDGFALLEYMIPDTPKLQRRANCPPPHWWDASFPALGWRVLRHTTAYDVLDLPHPYVPEPHRHSWGRLLARRTD